MTDKIPETYISSQVSETGDEIRLILKSHNIITFFHMTLADAQGVVAGLMETMEEAENKSKEEK